MVGGIPAAVQEKGIGLRDRLVRHLGGQSNQIDPYGGYQVTK